MYGSREGFDFSIFLCVRPEEMKMLMFKKLAKREREKLQKIMGIPDGTRMLRRKEGRSGIKRLVKGGNPSESDCFHQSQAPQIQRYSFIPSTYTMC